MALALLLTTGTNLLGIFTVPFLLCTLLGTGDVAASLDPVQLLVSLVKSILVPLLLGASARAVVPGVPRRPLRPAPARSAGLPRRQGPVCRRQPGRGRQQAGAVHCERPVPGAGALDAGVARRAAEHAHYGSWPGRLRRGRRPHPCRVPSHKHRAGGRPAPGPGLARAGWVLRALHLSSCPAPAPGRPSPVHAVTGTRRALVLCGSQKTLPIAVTVLNALAPMIQGPVGLAVIPCVVSHLLQIVLDSLLVQRWRRDPAHPAGAAARAA